MDVLIPAASLLPRVGRYGAQCLMCLTLLVGGALAGVGGVTNKTAPPPTASAEGGYELKAAFLYNFIPYVEWPDNKETHNAFELCVMGGNPFGAALEPLQGKTALNLPVTVKEVRQPLEARQCHILFIGASEQPHLAKIVAELAGAGVLTVGDTEGFAEAGVAINFIVRQNKLRFAINPEAAKNNRIHISAHLLRLAEIVP